MTRLRLVIDGRALVGHRTGIGVHTAEIARRLDFEPAPLIAAHTEIENRDGIEQLRFRVDRALLGVQWQQFTLARVAAEEGDVLWGPHGTLPLRLRTPAVVSMHDLTSLTMPHRHKLKTLASFNLFISRSLTLASSIAAVSRTTADELIRGFGVPPSKIEIVPNGVDPFFSPSGGEEVALPFDLQPEGYVLYVGTIEPRKGIGELITAWESLPSPRPRLVIVGNLGWNNGPLLKRIDTHPERPEIIVTGYLGLPILRELYRRAALFVYPSHYEGFGLPPLEAMACGTAVVTTDGGAIPEVVGDAAAVVKAGNAQVLGAVMRGLLRDRSARLELGARGIERAKRFNWSASAAIMQRLIERAATS